MKRKIMYLTIIFISILVVMFFIPNEVEAGYNNIDGIRYYVHYEGDEQKGFATIDGFDNENLPTDGIVIIPEKLKLNNIDYPVTQIRRQAFKECTKLTSITIPKTITSIENYAFERCTSLTSVTIKNKSLLTSIGQSTFDGCTSLINVTIPNDSLLNSIGERAFKDCTKLKEITLPKSLTTIGNHAFERCISIEEVTIPEASALNSIGNGAFKDCEKITSITLPKSLTSIGEYAFERCNLLTSVIMPNDSLLTSIGQGTFQDCKKLENITIPKLVTIIENYAFRYCDSLKTVTILEDSLLTSIGISAFWGCTALENIIIPKTVTSIAGMAFHNCKYVKLEYTGDFTNVLNNNDYYLTYSNGNFIAKLIATEGNKLIQNNISIKAGGIEVDSSSYSYNKEDGILTIPELKITGNIEITAVAKKPYNITINPVEGATITPNGTIEEILKGSNIDIKIKANQGYRIIAVKVNGVEQKLPLNNDMISIKDIKEDINVVLEVEKEGNEITTEEGITLREIDFIGDSDNQKFIKGTDKTLIFILDNDRGNGKVFVNGVELSEKNGDYTWAFLEGTYPTITLSEEYMKTLKPGKYTIEFEVENVGGAETIFTVVEQEKESEEDIIDNNSGNPSTGDNIVIYIATFMVSVIGISAIIISKKQNTKD